MQEFSLCADDAVAVVQTYIAHICMKAFEFHVGIGNVSLRCCDNLFLATYTLLKSDQAVKKHNIPMSQRQHRKLTPDCGKSHQGRRNTMAQPVYLQLELLSFCFKKKSKSSRSIAHSDVLEGHKSIQQSSWQQISWTRICYIGALHRATKPNPFWYSHVQPQISCNASAL